jgi:hypothetical protein
MLVITRPSFTYNVFFPSFQFNSKKIALYHLMLKTTNFSWFFFISLVFFAIGVVVIVVIFPFLCSCCGYSTNVER